MFKRRLFILLTFAVLSAQGQETAGPDGDRIRIEVNSSEAEAVLAIVAKHQSGSAALENDWKTLFSSEPYVRLQKREASMHRDFTDADFKQFVLSPDLASKAPALRRTLDAWKTADLTASAQRVLAYLPAEAHIRAKVFPVIKPKTNSFVFETATDLAIFLYLDPEESVAKFENTAAHEFHHIGYSSIASIAESKQKDVPADAKPAVEWMGAFGEGFAVLAAAGGPDVDPHAASSPQERARWQHDLANFNQDLGALQQFFLDVIDRKLVGEEQINQKAQTFFGDAQGPWYTVGYKMSVIVEKRFGRKVLIECMLDPRQLLKHYNQAAQELNQRNSENLALWSPVLLRKIGAQ
jgi:hypothetical protein